jgi:2-methylcitrate dehydratase PrpD
VRLTLKDGRSLEKYVEHAIGSKEVPMTNEQLEAKFRGLADDIIGPEQAARLLALAWSIEELADAAEICRMAAPAAQGAQRRSRA